MRNAFSRTTTQAIAGKGHNALRSEAIAAQSIMGPHLLPAARFAMDDGLRNGSPFFEDLELLKFDRQFRLDGVIARLYSYFQPAAERAFRVALRPTRNRY